MLEVTEKSLAVNEFKAFTIFQRFQFASYGFCMYIYKFFVPSGFSALHPYPSQTEYENNPIYIILLIISFIILAGCCVKHKKNTAVYFRCRFLFYHSGFCIAICICRCCYHRRALYIFTFCWLIFYDSITYSKIAAKYPLYGSRTNGTFAVMWLFQTRSQVDKWQNSDTLLSQVINRYPNAEQAYSIRGNYYGKQASILQ